MKETITRGDFNANELNKASTETWESYMSRLSAFGMVTQDQLSKWRSGSSVEILSTRTVQHIRKETRTRPGNAARHFTVEVPFDEQVVHFVTIAGKGEEADSIEFEEFPPPRLLKMPDSDSSRELRKLSMKTEVETWCCFVDRMQTLGVMNERQVEIWASGEDVEVEYTKQFTHVRDEARYCIQPRTTMATLTDENGRARQVAVTTICFAQYLAHGPYTETMSFRLHVPGKGKLLDTQSYPGLQLHNAV